MHPGDYSGHVIDLGIELTNVNTLSTLKNSEDIISTNANKIPKVNDQFCQQVKINQDF